MTYRIRELLAEKGMTQKDLSELTGVTESAISHYIKGDRTPRCANLVKIAKALGTTADDLLLSGDREIDRKAAKSDLGLAKAFVAKNTPDMTTYPRRKDVCMDNRTNEYTMYKAALWILRQEIDQLVGNELTDLKHTDPHNADIHIRRQQIREKVYGIVEKRVGTVGE